MVVAAGIRPNVELGRKAGLAVNRGIVVNDYMETSSPRVFAVGECVEHNGQVYGLVAPLLEQGKVLAATITGNKGPLFQGWKPAAKLKIMGVDVFSAGEFQENDGVEAVRYEDPALAYVELGNPEGPLTVRAGRQELNFGDQRLVGTADWLNVPRNCDAVRASFHSGGYRLDAFSAAIVAPQNGTFDHHIEGNNLHGLYGGLEKLIPNAVVEPNVFWRLAPRQKNEGGKLASLDSKTGGVRWVGKVP